MQKRISRPGCSTARMWSGRILPAAVRCGLTAHDPHRLALLPEVGHQAVAGLLARGSRRPSARHLRLRDLSDARATTTLTLTAPRPPPRRAGNRWGRRRSGPAAPRPPGRSRSLPRKWLPSRRELLVAADAAQVARQPSSPSGQPHGAAHHRVVAALDVDHDLRVGSRSCRRARRCLARARRARAGSRRACRSGSACRRGLGWAQASPRGPISAIE